MQSLRRIKHLASSRRLQCCFAELPKLENAEMHLLADVSLNLCSIFRSPAIDERPAVFALRPTNLTVSTNYPASLRTTGLVSTFYDGSQDSRNSRIMSATHLRIDVVFRGSGWRFFPIVGGCRGPRQSVIGGRVFRDRLDILNNS